MSSLNGEILLSVKLFLTVSGIAGAGKTTLLRALKEDFECYLEIASENPFLKQAFVDGAASQAFLSQKWFLDQQMRFLEKPESHEVIILDQDPRLIVRGYGQVLFEENNLSDSEFRELEDHLVWFENFVAEKEMKIIRIWLKMPADKAILRVEKRDGAEAALDHKWLRKVETAFETEFRDLKDHHSLDASSMHPYEIECYVRKVLDQVRQN